jgi:hypothetical protein
MAKAAKKDVAVVDTKNTLPAYLADYQGATGAETIDNEDVTIPRIKIGQDMSPEVQAGTVARGALYLNVTGEVLAEPGEVLEIVPIVQGKEFILWQDRNFDGGGILARAKKVLDPNTEEFRYAWDKPNQTFQNKIKGILPVEWNTLTYVDENGMDKFGSANVDDPDSHPAATAHHNYVVVLPGHDNLVAALSLSNSQVKKAKDFNAMLKMGTAPIFARKFAVTTWDDTSKAGDDFKNIEFKPAGFVEDENVFTFTKGLFDSFSHKGFTVDQSDGDSGDSAKKSDKF